ncbi:MAG TPA: PAS domain-containing protein [Acidobacteriaceae bacterium]|nr:PAS domain-containing protein [Acidobacteriaceae bacterium]
MPLQDALGQIFNTDRIFRRQMAQFFDATTDAIAFLDHEYRFTFLNRRAQELLAPGGQILGRVIFECFPDTVYEGSPYLATYRRTMEEGVPGDFEAFYPDPLNLWFRIQSYPADVGMMLFFRDITQERAAAAALIEKSDESERQRAEIETLYRTAPIGLALFDLPGYHYVRLNERQAAFFGLRPEEIVGKTLTQMAPIPGLRELFDQVAAGEPVINFPLEGSLVTDPDEHRYWLVSYFPVHASDGSITGITAASLEVTQQRKAEQALLQSEKLAVVGRLASSIAHEINNPLESVTNLLYLAQTSEDLVEVREYLQMAERELRRAAAITTQTLRFHKQATSPQEITSEQLFESVLSVYHGRLVNSSVSTVERLRAAKPVRCFEGEIRQVISNLVSNALDAMNPTGGILRLRSREATHWPTGERGLTLTIADNGSGMSPSTQAKLFNPFFTTKGITGTGLGLWVSKEIVDRHHGALRVRSSQGPGRRGTVFTLFLPFRAVFR